MTAAAPRHRYTFEDYLSVEEMSAESLNFSVSVDALYDDAGVKVD